MNAKVMVGGALLVAGLITGAFILGDPDAPPTSWPDGGVDGVDPDTLKNEISDSLMRPEEPR